MARLEPPANGVTVRMYRQGHGDCFLLAFPRKDGGGEPVYVLIDCGYKPGSQKFVSRKPIGDIVKHIAASTDNRLDLMVITHEHQDHVNGIWKKRDPYFKDFTIEEAWFAWTESATDPLAIELRERHKDQLLGLVEARHQLALAVGEDDQAVHRLDSLLSLELGGARDAAGRDAMFGAASDPAKSTNKQAMKLVKDKAVAHRGFECLEPGGSPLEVPGTDGYRVWVLGPPKDEDLLTDEDPVGEEAFGDGGSHGLSFAAAARAAANGDAGRTPPFREKFCLSPDEALPPPPSPADLANGGPEPSHFFVEHYGRGGEGESLDDKIMVPDNADWRRIDEEWLFAAESLALKLNRGINNTSLVLAFELPRSRKVLLFVGDAQRGNWLSWSRCEWDDGDEDKARDLLARTVLYKVGHHGSHNATLKGTDDDDYPNLAWMGHGAFAGEFTAMITAVNKWALEKNDPPWRHPLPSIRKELVRKTEGRVFQTDQDQPKKPRSVSKAEWKKFTDRATFDKLFFDYTILDEV